MAPTVRPRSCRHRTRPCRRPRSRRRLLRPSPTTTTMCSRRRRPRGRDLRLRRRSRRRAACARSSRPRPRRRWTTRFRSDRSSMLPPGSGGGATSGCDREQEEVAVREPTLDELFAFNALIMKSVAKRYEGGLIVEDPRGKHAPTYLPEETQENKGDIWDLLIELWGELVTIDALEQIREETHRGRSR